MKLTIDVDPWELEDDDTVCGYRVKDLCLIARCMDKEGVTNYDVSKFVRTFDNANRLVRKEYEEVLRKATMFNYINYPFGKEANE